MKTRSRRRSWFYHLRVLLRPHCWLQNYPYSKDWDQKLRSMIESHRFEADDQYTARLGGMDIWIENHPYASFRPDDGKLPRVTPSRATILFAYDILMEDFFAASGQSKDIPELEKIFGEEGK
jgi:hypothetical protein